MVNLKKLFLTLGIAILASLFIFVLVDAIFERPEYTDFCEERIRYPKVVDSSLPDCAQSAEDRAIAQQCYESKGTVIYNDYSTGCPTKAECSMCNSEYNDASDAYNAKVFYITAPIGLALIILGLFLPISLDAAAWGLMLAGIITLIQSTGRSFGGFGKVTRVIILGVELAILIWISYKKSELMKDGKSTRTRKTKRKNSK